MSWLLLGVVVGPFIEELVFRFGVLQTVRKRTGSGAKAVIVSSTAFAVGHFGYLPPDEAHLVNSGWLFFASLLLGQVTLRRNGRVTLSVTAHMARNALEVLLLFLLGRPTSAQM
jgi:membrane protease YdiL (CAAX protease family)